MNNSNSKSNSMVWILEVTLLFIDLNGKNNIIKMYIWVF